MDFIKTKKYQRRWRQLLFTMVPVAGMLLIPLQVVAAPTEGTGGSPPVPTGGYNRTPAECNRAFLPDEPAKNSACIEEYNNEGSVSDELTSELDGLRGSSIECGDGGVKLGVSINDDEDCIGEGDSNPIFEYLGGIVRFLSVGVGVVVTAMIVVGGIQYSTAGGNPQAVEAAKQRIWNAIIALILYIFMVGITNFLVPGGVL